MTILSGLTPQSGDTTWTLLAKWLETVRGQKGITDFATRLQVGDTEYRLYWKILLALTY